MSKTLDVTRETTSPVAIIPTRGGSKGVERKNLRVLCGKPLIGHTIEAAQQAKIFQQVVVSTDDDEILRCAEQFGAQVYRHPKELSEDNRPTYPVVRWIVEQLKAGGLNPEIRVVLRATTPLRTGDDIVRAVDLLQQTLAADSVVSVCHVVGVHPLRLKRITDSWLNDAFSQMFGTEGLSPKPRQEFEALYVRNGGIYASRAPVIEDLGLWGKRCLAYVMPNERSVNINSEYDWQVAEAFMSKTIG